MSRTPQSEPAVPPGRSRSFFRVPRTRGRAWVHLVLSVVFVVLFAIQLATMDGSATQKILATVALLAGLVWCAQAVYGVREYQRRR